MPSDRDGKDVFGRMLYGTKCSQAEMLSRKCLEIRLTI